MKTIKEQEQKQDQLAGIEEVLDRLVKQVVELKNKKIDFPKITLPDYTSRFDQIFSKIEAMGQVLDGKIRNLPEQVPIRHHIETRSKGFLITGLILVLVSAFSIGLFAYTWSANRELKANDLKYRMIHFQFPQADAWADSIYQKDPKAARRVTIELEREERAILKAEAEARQKEAAATEARQEADRLKEQ